jgi:hypothetical protein
MKLAIPPTTTLPTSALFDASARNITPSWTERQHHTLARAAEVGEVTDDKTIAALRASRSFNEFMRETSSDPGSWQRARDNNAGTSQRHILWQQFRHRRVKRKASPTLTTAAHASPTATTTTPTLSGWAALRPEAKARRVMVDLLMEKTGLTEPAALERYAQSRGRLTDILASDENLREAKLHGDHQLNIDRWLKVEMQLREFLSQNLASDRGRALAHASDLLGRKSLPPILVRDAYLFGLEDALESWLDPAKARTLRPTEVLAAVLHRHGQTLPADFYRNFTVEEPAIHRVLDEAGLLHNRLQHGDALAGIDKGPDLFKRLRGRFIGALSADLDKQSILDAMFAKPGGSHGDADANDMDRPSPYFDGFAFRNALNLTLNDLSSLPPLNRMPGLVKLDRAPRRALIEEKFAAIGESGQYRIGTAQHSLAGTVIRVLRYQSRPVPERFGSDRELLERFKAVEEDWAKNWSYPVHPRLLFALHLARSRGACMATKDWKARVWANPDLSAAAAHVKKSFPMKVLIANDPMMLRNLTSGYFQDKRMRFEHIATGSSHADPKSVAAAHDWTLFFAGHEVIEGDDWRAKTHSLMRYASDALLASYGDPPRFDPRQAATAVLRQQGVSDADVLKRRTYTIDIVTPSYSHAPIIETITNNGTLVDEFVQRVALANKASAMLALPDGQRIDTGKMLESSKRNFNAALHRDPWVCATAKELLRVRQRALTRWNLDAQARQIADRYQEPPSDAGAFSWADLIRFIPAIGPLYDIEEGIRHKDPVRVVLGTICLPLQTLARAAGQPRRRPRRHGGRSRPFRPGATRRASAGGTPRTGGSGTRGGHRGPVEGLPARACAQRRPHCPRRAPRRVLP